MLDNIYGVLFRPNQTFPGLAQRQYLVSAFFIVFLIGLIDSVNKALVFDSPKWALGLLVVFTVGAYFLFWLVGSLLLTFTADLLGGAGKITDTMIGLAYALLPLIFLGPARLLTSGLGTTGAIFQSFFKLVIFIWVFALTVLALKYVHRFHSTQAFMSIFSIFLLGIILSFVASVMFFSGTVFLFSLF